MYCTLFTMKKWRYVYWFMSNVYGSITEKQVYACMLSTYHTHTCLSQKDLKPNTLRYNFGCQLHLHSCVEQVPFIGLYRREECLDLSKEATDEFPSSEGPTIQQYKVHHCYACRFPWNLADVFTITSHMQLIRIKSGSL